jgi:hypothetical protein
MLGATNMKRDGVEQAIVELLMADAVAMALTLSGEGGEAGPPQLRRHQCERALGAACEGFHGRGVIALDSAHFCRPPQASACLGAACEGFYGRGVYPRQPEIPPTSATHPNLTGTSATSPAAGGVRGVSPRQPSIPPASAATEERHEKEGDLVPREAMSVPERRSGLKRRSKMPNDPNDVVGAFGPTSPTARTSTRCT